MIFINEITGKRSSFLSHVLELPLSSSGDISIEYTLKCGKVVSTYLDGNNLRKYLHLTDEDRNLVHRVWAMEDSGLSVDECFMI